MYNCDKMEAKGKTYNEKAIENLLKEKIHQADEIRVMEYETSTKSEDENVMLKGEKVRVNITVNTLFKDQIEFINRVVGWDYQHISSTTNGFVLNYTKVYDRENIE